MSKCWMIKHDLICSEHQIAFLSLTNMQVPFYINVLYLFLKKVNLLWNKIHFPDSLGLKVHQAGAANSHLVSNKMLIWNSSKYELTFLFWCAFLGRITLTLAFTCDSNHLQKQNKKEWNKRGGCMKKEKDILGVRLLN